MIISGRGAIKRVCDVCGAYRDARPGVFRMVRNRLVCSRHDSYVPPEVLDKIPYQTFKVRNIKNARPFNPRDTYENAEWQIFNFATGNYSFDFTTISDGAEQAPSVSGSFTRGVRGAGWVGEYLYQLIVENKRPLSMIAAAKTKLREVADWLLTKILAYPGRPGTWTSDDHGWGGFPEAGTTTSANNVFNTAHTAGGGLALLRAYQVLGTSSYLDAARAALWHCRSAQCGGYLATGFSSSDAAGTARKNFGTFATRTVHDVSGVQFDHTFAPSTLVALEFYKRFRDAIGDELVGSSNTAGRFSTSRQILLSSAIEEAKTFWTTGTFDATLGRVVNGLSSATPFHQFNAYPAVKGGTFSPSTGTGSWRYFNGEQATGTQITAENWAHGMRALSLCGVDMTSLFDWLMTFGSNSANVPPTVPVNRMSLAGLGDKELWASTKGTYDPRVALAITLRVRDGSPLADVKYEDTGTAYSLSTVGLLAGMWAARQPAAFKALKDQLNVPQPWTKNGAEDGRHYYLGPMGRCGLSYQPRSTATTGFLSAYSAALLGLIYRELPGAFLGRGH